MEFSRQEYWSGLPFTSPGDLSDPGIEASSPAWQAILYHRATRQLALVCLILIKCLDDYHSESPIYIYIYQPNVHVGLTTQLTSAS